MSISFNVFTAVKLRPVVWIVTPSLVGGYRHFEGTYHKPVDHHPNFTAVKKKKKTICIISITLLIVDNFGLLTTKGNLDDND
jgi:hypothetical protein